MHEGILFDGRDDFHVVPDQIPLSDEVELVPTVLSGLMHTRCLYAGLCSAEILQRQAESLRYGRLESLRYDWAVLPVRH